MTSLLVALDGERRIALERLAGYVYRGPAGTEARSSENAACGAEGDEETPRLCARVGQQAAQREGCEAGHRGTAPLAVLSGRAVTDENVREIYVASHTEKIIVSCVPEDGTHGLKGELRSGLAYASTALNSTNGGQHSQWSHRRR